MHIIYAPADGDRQEWDYDPEDIRASEAELIEKRFGENFGIWAAGVQQGNMRARRVLLWFLMRRQHHTLRYEDVPDFLARELKLEYTVAELTELREMNEKATFPSEALKERTLAGIDYQLTEAMAREQAAAEQPPGKAKSKVSVADGGTSSPAS